MINWIKSLFPKKKDYWRDIIYGMPPVPSVEYELVTDPKTGHTTRVEKPRKLIPWEIND